MFFMEKAVGKNGEVEAGRSFGVHPAILHRLFVERLHLRVPIEPIIQIDSREDAKT